MWYTIYLNFHFFIGLEPIYTGSFLGLVTSFRITRAGVVLADYPAMSFFLCMLTNKNPNANKLSDQLFVYWLSVCSVANIYCKSLLCSMFNEQTCSRFTRLVGRCSSPCPEYLIMLYFWKALGPRTSKLIYTNTISQCFFHEYLNKSVLCFITFVDVHNAN